MARKPTAPARLPAPAPADFLASEAAREHPDLTAAALRYAWPASKFEAAVARVRQAAKDRLKG